MRETERRQIDPGVVAQQYECDEDRRRGGRRSRRARRRRSRPASSSRRGVMISRGEQEVDEHDAERDRRARGAVPAARRDRRRGRDGRDHQAVLDDVEGDLALDSGTTGFVPRLPLLVALDLGLVRVVGRERRRRRRRAAPNTIGEQRAGAEAAVDEPGRAARTSTGVATNSNACDSAFANPCHVSGWSRRSPAGTTPKPLPDSERRAPATVAGRRL